MSPDKETIMDDNNEIIKADEVLMAPTEEQLDKIEEEEIEYYDTFDYSSSGRAVIPIGLNDKASFFSPFCVKGDEELAPELFEYIMQQENKLSIREAVEICIFSDKIPSKKNRESMASALRGRFAEEIVQINTTLRRNIFFSIIFMLIGIMVEGLAAYFAIAEITIPYLFLDLFGWVFLWQALDNLVLVQMPDRIRRKRCRNLLRAEIRFRLNES